MTTSPVRPSYEDVVEQINRLRVRSGDFVHSEPIGQTPEGRDIPCAVLTDRSVPSDDKQHVLIVASQHGAEESGRAMAMALMDFLASGEAEAPEVLRRQVVAFVPCASPDGAVRDSNRNAEGMDVAHTYAFDGPAGTPEGRQLEAFALRFTPDVVVDIHGRAGGGMKELAWLMPAWKFSSDRYFLTAMSMEMARAGEAVGFPQCELDPPSPLQPRQGHVAMLGEKLAYELKTLGLGLETIEHYYRQDDWRVTGAARLRRLLRFGMADEFGLGEPGYPNMLVSGNRIQGLKACGRTAAARRESRVALTRFLRRNFAVVDRGADGVDGCARVRVFSKTCDGDNPGRFAVLLRFKKPSRIESVTWRDTELASDDEHGYRVWEDACSRLVQVNIAEPFGGAERLLVVRYESPYFEQHGPVAGT